MSRTGRFALNDNWTKKMSHTEFVEALRKALPRPFRVSHVRDKNGTPLTTGDVISIFLCNEANGIALCNEGDPGSHESVDLVEWINGEFFAVSYDVGGGKALSKLEGRCVRRGSVVDEDGAEALKRLTRFENATAWNLVMLRRIG